jgi:hypothetical protein
MFPDEVQEAFTAYARAYPTREPVTGELSIYDHTVGTPRVGAGRENVRLWSKADP